MSCLEAPHTYTAPVFCRERSSVPLMAAAARPGMNSKTVLLGTGSPRRHAMASAVARLTSCRVTASLAREAYTTSLSDGVLCTPSPEPKSCCAPSPARKSYVASCFDGRKRHARFRSALHRAPSPTPRPYSHLQTSARPSTPKMVPGPEYSPSQNPPTYRLPSL